MKLGARSMEGSLLELINEAKEEIQILSYSMTHGAERILKAIERALSRGVKLTMIINHVEALDNGILSTLKEMSQNYTHSKIYAFRWSEKSELHAKLLISDRVAAIVGSSNLTSRGLIWNLEIGFLIKDKTVWTLANMVDRISETSILQ